MKIYKIGQDFDNYKFFVFKENDELNKGIWDFRGQSLISGWKGLNLELFRDKRKKKDKRSEDFDASCFFSGHLIVNKRTSLLLSEKLKDQIEVLPVNVVGNTSEYYFINVLNTIKSLNLDITRSAFSGGEKISSYIEAFSVDLFLSKNESDVQEVIDSKLAAAALILEPPSNFISETGTVRIAYDADAELFSDESEQIYKSQGMAAFHKNETDNENIPLKEGPHGKLLKTLSRIQQYMDTTIELTPLRLAIVTARNSPSHMRVIKTLREWDVYVDEAFFLGGMSKDKVLKAFNAHIFFDDQDVHLDGARKVVPSAKVPYSSDSPLRTFEK